MAAENRIRMDFVGKECVKVTKSTIVAAVKLLEQNPQVTLSGSSRDVINYVAANLIGKHDSNHIVFSIIWNDTTKQHEVVTSTLEFDIVYSKIDLMPISVGLPKKISELILLTNQASFDAATDEFK